MSLAELHTMDVLYQWACLQLTLISCHVFLGNDVLSGTEIQHPLSIEAVVMRIKKKTCYALRSLIENLALHLKLRYVTYRLLSATKL